VTWFLTTRLGRLILASLSAMGILGAVYVKGRRDQTETYTRRRVEAMREAMEVRDEVQGKSAADVDSDIRKWMRDDK
jgi:hypothetical protein